MSSRRKIVFWNDGTATVTWPHASRRVRLTDEQYRRWRKGEMIQNAMPHLSADDREFIMTGITDWEALFEQDD